MTGIDVSHHQGLMQWQTAAQRGAQFAFIRGLYGFNKDGQFARNWAESRGHMRRGAYLYMLAASDPVRQAQALRSLCGEDPGDLPPALDLEYNSKIDGAANDPRRFADYRLRVERCLRELEQQFGCTPIVYSGPSFITAHLATPLFARYPLWIANYKTNLPTVPYPWPALGWRIWQFTCTWPGQEYGAQSRSIDVNVMQGEI